MVINVQGDEPLIDPTSLELLADLLRQDPKAEMATLAMPIANEETYRNPNCVKVVCGEGGKALYFSRSPIPYVRDGQPEFGKQPPRFLHHLGLYAYRRAALLALSTLPPHRWNRLEKLEQLRALGARVDDPRRRHRTRRSRRGHARGLRTFCCRVRALTIG